MMVRNEHSLFVLDFSQAMITGRAHVVVVYPNSTEDVVKVVQIANKHRTPVIPYSGGTSLEGHFVGVSTC